MKAWRIEHPEYFKNLQRKYNRKIRKEVLAAYGNICRCCGETTPEFLAIDHVNGDGKAHRESLGGSGGLRVYLDLRKRGYPQEGFQLLCHNCNLAKGFYGACPHRREESASTRLITSLP